MKKRPVGAGLFFYAYHSTLAAIVPAAAVAVTIAIAIVPVVPAMAVATPMLVTGSKPDTSNGKGENGQHSADKPAVHFFLLVDVASQMKPSASNTRS
ncbi:MAG: hypothetical protein K0S54_35 [Alphaproteobacteria bacterium]|jgi:hypothetical protein|nr:hypothetical protein [Alphaproteobacteria bacterium]